MFDDAIKKSQGIAKFLFSQITGGNGIEGLVQVNETLLDMAKNGGQDFCVDGSIGIARAKLNQRGNNSQTAQSAKFIGIIQNTPLQGNRFPFIGSNSLGMCQDNLLNFCDTPSR